MNSAQGALKSRRILIEMGSVLTAGVLVAAGILLWKHDSVVGVMLGDMRPILLNGLIVLLFALGVWRLYRAIQRYEQQERDIEGFLQARADGVSCPEFFATTDSSSLLAGRWFTIKDLFSRGGPVDHGAISAVMTAEESLHQSFPRFVNNVLILTGVFGTVSSLIFALLGASDVLQTSAPDAGMGLLLLGMNTALTTTATAIVCYFFFTYFFHRFTDLQTWVLSRVERVVLVHMVPEFTFEPEAVNHQAKLLVEEVRELVGQMREAMAGVGETVSQLDEGSRARLDQGKQMIARQDIQNEKLDETLSRLTEVREALARGFRLDR